MQLLEAFLLGLVEGITEYLPISSTGHLILVSHGLRLHGPAIKSFEVIIQGGAIAAVMGLYHGRVSRMWRGLWGLDVAGRRLLMHLGISFVPAAVMGILWHRPIKAHLFAAWPVVAALAVGGLVMIAVERWVLPQRAASVHTLEAMTPRHALLIGLAQALALWPGMSRAMVTMVAGMLLGLRRTAAAEYSFLLALPTLGAAAVFDVVSGAGGVLTEIGWSELLIGFVTAFLVAMAAMRGLVRYLNRHGLAPFGWYRLVLAGILWVGYAHGPGDSF